VTANSKSRQPTFFGRASELDELARRFDAGHRIVTVVGLGGVGKTRLAEEYLRRFEPGGVFVDLTEAHSRGSLIDALGRAELSSRLPPLMVLDNFEQLVEKARIVGELSAAHPDLRILVTSREMLRLADESVLELSPFDVRAPGGVDAAVGLMVHRIRKRRGQYAPNAEETSLIARIAQDADGIPLALEVAADRAALLGVPSVARSLEPRVHLPATGLRDARERRATIFQVLDDSWESLSFEERGLWQAAGVFHGHFLMEALLAVYEPRGVSSVDALQRLREKALITAGPTGFRLLGVIAEYVKGQTDPEARAILERRAAAYFASRVEGDSRREAEASGFIADQWDNLIHTVNHFMVAPGGLEAAVRVLLSIGNTALGSGHAAGLRERIDAVLEHAARESLGKLLLSQLWLLRSRAEAKVGNLVPADADLDRALALANERGDAGLSARILGEKRSRLAQVGELDDVLAGAVRTHKPNTPLGDSSTSATNAMAIASTARQKLEFAHARVALENFLRAARHPTNRGLVLCELALCLLDQGDHGEARRRAMEAKVIFHEAGWRAEVLRADVTLALERHLSESPAEAESLYRGVLDTVGQGVQTSVSEAAAGGLAVLLLEADRLDEAEEILSAVNPPDRGHALLYAAYRAVAAARRNDLALARAIAEALKPEEAPPRLRVAIGLYALHLDLAEARVAVAHAEEPSAAAALQRVTTTLAAVRPVGYDARLAERIARGAVERHFAASGIAQPQSIEVHPRAEWFSVGGQPRVDLRKSAGAREALSCLVEERLRRPGVNVGWQTLVERIWRGEAMLEHAAKNRLRVTMAGLRKAGLKELLLSETSGYRLSEWALVSVVQDP
jgi:predicted ATPase/tetratricopeptide (TPR) repeat protein